MKYIAIFILGLGMLLPNSLIAQRFDDNNGQAWYGGGPIANQSSISGIYGMLVDETIFLPTPHDERIVDAIGGALWTRFGAPDSDFFIEGQFSFQSMLKTSTPLNEGHFHLENDMGLNYSILFDYDQVGFSMFPGWFIPLPERHRSAFGMYITSGITWALLTGTSIDYVSNEPQFDLAIEESLEQGFKYRNDLILHVGGGIQFKFPNNDGFALEARYTQGWGQIDIIETQNNPYFWREQENKTRVHHQVALTFLIRFDD